MTRRMIRRAGLVATVALLLVAYAVRTGRSQEVVFERLTLTLDSATVDGVSPQSLTRYTSFTTTITAEAFSGIRFRAGAGSDVFEALYLPRGPGR